MDYNKKYIFISDGTWFDKGTECTVEDGDSMWSYGIWNYGTAKKEFTLEEMNEHRGDIGGIFRGIRTCENSAAEGGRPVGEKYDDGEVCGMDEFEIRRI